MNGIVEVTKKLKWSEIKVGQSFYYYGCEGIGIKINEYEAISIEDTKPSVEPGQLFDLHCVKNCELYELPAEIAEAIEESLV